MYYSSINRFLVFTASILQIVGCNKKLRDEQQQNIYHPPQTSVFFHHGAGLLVELSALH
jgi:hypothetical protein